MSADKPPFIVQSPNVPIKVWIPPTSVESQALDQLRNIASLPIVFKHIAVMPDVHLGRGATVGSVIATKGAICPAAVGVDIGCGMAAIKTSLKASDLPDNLDTIYDKIVKAIPHGNGPEGSRADVMDVKGLATLFDEYKNLHENIQDSRGRAMSQIGTLGGGNHFVELCLDDGICGECDEGAIDVKMGYEKCLDCDGHGIRDPRVWMMLHSGSRNIGQQLANIHISKAKKLGHNVGLPDKDLAYFLSKTPEMAAYRHDLFWAQRYAFLNRQAMLEAYKRILNEEFKDIEYGMTVQCHHNYVAEEVHFGEEVLITRKGAISARRGEMGIIPGSMGTKSYIVRGLGEAESFHSASHGAGRVLSRTAAKDKFGEHAAEEIAKQLGAVKCRRDNGILDELPGAYKDIDMVIEAQKDLVQVVATLKQVLCVKG
jgi:tRNA-splicing ligase RtcB (3'-phosphate/5'-hydroxy nucleic acid ligase)